MLIGARSLIHLPASLHLPVCFTAQSPEQLHQIEQEAMRLSEEIKAEYWAVSAKSGGNRTRMPVLPRPLRPAGLFHPLFKTFKFSPLLQETGSRTSSSAWRPWLSRPMFCPSWRREAHGTSATSSVSQRKLVVKTATVRYLPAISLMNTKRVLFFLHVWG